MDSFNLFKGYGRVDDDRLEDQAPQPKTPSRKPLITTISIFALLFLTLTIGLILGALIHESNSETPETRSAPFRINSTESIKAVCNVTRFPASCFSGISSVNNKIDPSDPEAIFKLSLEVSINELSKLSSLFKTLANSNSDGPALTDCKDQIDDALSRLNDSMSAMEVGPGDKVLTDAKVNNIQTWISAAVTDQETCLDGLEETQSRAIGEVKSKMQRSKEYSSNSLAIIANIGTLLQQFHMSRH